MNSQHDCWLIHKTWSGDTSARVLFFTRDMGLVHAWYKGARSPKKQALLQAFTPLWVDFTKRREWYYVQHLESTAASMPLSHHHLYSALYLNELLYLALRPEDHHETLFDVYVATLGELSQSLSMPMLEGVLRRFEWHLLVSMGYGISLSHDAQTMLPIQCDQYYQLRLREGFVQAEKGILGQYILALSRDELDDPVVLKIAKWMMRQLVDDALGGKEITSRRFFETRTLTSGTIV